VIVLGNPGVHHVDARSADHLGEFEREDRQVLLFPEFGAPVEAVCFAELM